MFIKAIKEEITARQLFISHCHSNGLLLLFLQRSLIVCFAAYIFRVVNIKLMTYV